MVKNYDLKRFSGLVLGFDTMNLQTDRSYNEKMGELARVKKSTGRMKKEWMNMTPAYM